MEKKLGNKVRIGDLSARAGEARQELSAQELALVAGGRPVGTYHYFKTGGMCGGPGGDTDENGYSSVDEVA